MKKQKQVTIEQKLNEFLKGFESSTFSHHCVEHFQTKYKGLDKSEIEILYNKCLEIESFGMQQALAINQGLMSIQNAKDEIFQRYPFLEAKRIDRLMSRKLYELIR